MPKCWDCGALIYGSQTMRLVEVEVYDRTVEMPHHEHCAERMDA